MPKTMCVTAESRNMGLIEADLRTRDAKGIFVQTDSDKPAYNFYHKNGFKDSSKHVSLFKSFKTGEDK